MTEKRSSSRSNGTNGSPQEKATSVRQSRNSLQGPADWPLVALESAPFGVMVHDRSGRILMFNPQLEKISGYSREEIPDVGTWIAKLYPDPEYRELVSEAHKSKMVENRLRVREAIITRSDGQKRICEFSSILSSSGIRTVFIKDTNELREAENSLRESEERFRLFSQATFEGILIHKEGVLLYANAQFFEMFGYQAQELMGKQTLFLCIAPDSLPFVKEQIRSGTSTPYEVTGRRRNGSTFPIQVRGKSMEFHENEVRVAAIRDLSQRRRSQEALRESEEKFKTVTEQSPNMIFINRRGRVVYANRKCEQIMGYSRDEFYAPDFDFMLLIAPESRDLIRANYKKHLRGEEAAPYEYALIDRHGRKIDVIITTKLIHYDGERSILGIVTDISERKDKDRRLKQQAKNLEEVNTALKVILEQREKEKAELKESLLVSIKRLVYPYIEKLEKKGVDDDVQTYVNVIRSNLNGIVSPLAGSLSSRYYQLTPSEIQIADLIKEGKTSKEIAGMLNISPKAVSFHRGNLRKKLGLSNKKTNLRTHLLTFPN